MLELKNIKKTFDKKVVLGGISLQIQDGEIVSMLGLSGSGKTTLLNIILGLIPMDSGSIIYNGVDISNVPMKKRGFNIVFQDYALFPNLNAYKNIVYGLKNKPDLLSHEELEDIIDFLELRPHLSKKIEQLSGGQKQRVALARTLVTKPKILLLDEPLSALDGVIKETIKCKIKAITQKYNITTIIVTHDPEEALTMSDKVLIIDKGSISQYGTPKEVITKPNNSFVEEFIVHQLQIKRENIYHLFGECYV
jgi:iron(III) transport system ATP-binding protein